MCLLAKSSLVVEENINCRKTCSEYWTLLFLRERVGLYLEFPSLFIVKKLCYEADNHYTTVTLTSGFGL